LHQRVFNGLYLYSADGSGDQLPVWVGSRGISEEISVGDAAFHQRVDFIIIRQSIGVSICLYKVSSGFDFLEIFQSIFVSIFIPVKYTVTICIRFGGIGMQYKDFDIIR